MAIKVLIVDDDAAVLDMLRDFFPEPDYRLFAEVDGNSALRTVQEHHPHVAVIDIRLAGESGLDLLQKLKDADPRLSVIMTTGFSTTHYAIDAMKLGAYDYLTKPFDLGEMEAIVRKAYDAAVMSRSVRYAGPADVADDGGEEDVMIGASGEMIQIWKLVGKMAVSDAPILIHGESGTGKDLLARAIYNNSKRKDQPFLAVNCAMPEQLLERELFGHEAGACPDAHFRRIGKLEQCDGGTIFLDEVAEMPLAVQGKLLRVLEEQSLERLGGDETVKVSVRLIASSSRSLLDAVHDRLFRMDLFYRLKVFSFYLPPLRERVEDIPLLAEFFLRQFCRESGIDRREISEGAMQLLLLQRWPGNIRQLRNVVTSAAVFGKSAVLTEDDVYQFLVDGDEADIALARPDRPFTAPEEEFMQLLGPVFGDVCRYENGRVYETLMSGLEKTLVTLAMKRCNGNQVMAARMLGISRNTLRDRLDKYV